MIGRSSGTIWVALSDHSFLSSHSYYWQRACSSKGGHLMRPKKRCARWALSPSARSSSRSSPHLYLYWQIMSELLEVRLERPAQTRALHTLKVVKAILV